MKRTFALLAAGTILALLLPHGAWAFGVKDVVMMSQDGVPDSLIIAKIRHSDTRFQLDAKDFRTLKFGGVSNDVVSAMLKTEDQPNSGWGSAWPYGPVWLVDLGWYSPYYHGWAPAYGWRGYRHGYRPIGRRFR